MEHERLDFYEMFGKNALGYQKTCVDCPLCLPCMLRVLDGNAFFRCRHCNQVNFVNIDDDFWKGEKLGKLAYCIRVPAPCPVGVRLTPSSTYCDMCQVAVDDYDAEGKPRSASYAKD